MILGPNLCEQNKASDIAQREEPKENLALPTKEPESQNPKRTENRNEDERNREQSGRVGDCGNRNVRRGTRNLRSDEQSGERDAPRNKGQIAGS